MKFILTYVPVSRKTRKRIGKALNVVIDTTKDPEYMGVQDPRVLERLFEDYNEDGQESVKVVDIREARDK